VVKDIKRRAVAVSCPGEDDPSRELSKRLRDRSGGIVTLPGHERATALRSMSFTTQSARADGAHIDRPRRRFRDSSAIERPILRPDPVTMATRPDILYPVIHL